MVNQSGRILSQRYRLIRSIGHGSQASVWVSEHLALQTHVAVKLIDPELAKKESARERFKREATAAAQLRSAHVVQILDHGIDDGQPFIVMELLDGEDLFERLSKRTRLTLKETAKVVTQVARALSRAHAAGVIHRDLKPENVFLVSNEDDEVVKVLDFGVAKVKDPAKAQMQKTSAGTLIGTPHYMSPEQVKGIGEIDYRADLWALGVIAFQCITGELPFDSEGVGDLLIKITLAEIPVPSKIFPGTPPGFDTWFARACAREAVDRFQSAREMALALAALVSGEGTRAPTMRPPPALAGAAPAPKLTQELGEADLEEIFDWEEELPAAKAAKRSPSEVDDEAPTVFPPRPLSEITGSAHIRVPTATPAGGVPRPPSSRPSSEPINPFLVDAPLPPPAKVAVIAPHKVEINAPPPPASSPEPFPSTVSGLSRSGIPTIPPPELDAGSRRRKMVRVLIAGIVIAGLAVAWGVIKSQLVSQPAAGGLDSASAPPPPAPMPSPSVTTTAAPTVSAVDPGKVLRPIKPTPTGYKAPQGGPKPPPKKKPPQQPSDGTIEIPDPPAGDAVPPAD